MHICRSNSRGLPSRRRRKQPRKPQKAKGLAAFASGRGEMDLFLTAFCGGVAHADGVRVLEKACRIRPHPEVLAKFFVFASGRFWRQREDALVAWSPRLHIGHRVVSDDDFDRDLWPPVRTAGALAGKPSARNDCTCVAGFTEWARWITQASLIPDKSMKRQNLGSHGGDRS